MHTLIRASNPVRNPLSLIAQGVAQETDVMFIADVDYFIPSDVLQGALKYVARGRTCHCVVAAVGRVS